MLAGSGRELEKRPPVDEARPLPRSIGVGKWSLGALASVHFAAKPAKSTVGCHEDGPAVDLFQPMKYLEQLPPTEEMRECCSILGQKMLHWPGVKMYHVFGTRAFYHRKVMFAMLPDKRSLDSCTAITFKSSATSQSNPGPEWKTFELKNRALVDDALVSLEKAYKDSIL